MVNPRTMRRRQARLRRFFLTVAVRLAFWLLFGKESHPRRVLIEQGLELTEEGA